MKNVLGLMLIFLSTSSMAGVCEMTTTASGFLTEPSARKPDAKPEISISENSSRTMKKKADCEKKLKEALAPKQLTKTTKKLCKQAGGLLTISIASAFDGELLSQPLVLNVDCRSIQ